jgi:hypothetical protein
MGDARRDLDYRGVGVRLEQYTDSVDSVTLPAQNFPAPQKVGQSESGAQTDHRQSLVESVPPSSRGWTEVCLTQQLLPSPKPAERLQSD